MANSQEVKRAAPLGTARFVLDRCHTENYGILGSAR